MVSLRGYILLSACLAAGTILHAAYTKEQFYATTIYLSTNKFNVFHVIDKCKYAVTELCLALTIFRQDVNYKVGFLFVILVGMKVFHWTGTLRVEAVATRRELGWFYHFRLLSLISFLTVIDAITIYFYWDTTSDLGVLLLFIFEYTVLLVSAVSIGLKYLVLLADARRVHCSSKPTFMFLIGLQQDFLTLALNVVFFFVIFTKRGIPLYMIRELYRSYMDLKNRIGHYIRFRLIVASMSKYDDVEDFGDSDRTCIICRDDMDLGKRIPCGHVFHAACLRQWIEKQDKCPTCRASIPLSGPPQRDANALNQQPQQPLNPQAQAVNPQLAPGGHGIPPPPAGFHPYNQQFFQMPPGQQHQPPPPPPPPHNQSPLNPVQIPQYPQQQQPLSVFQSPLPAASPYAFPSPHPHHPPPPPPHVLFPSPHVPPHVPNQAVKVEESKQDESISSRDNDVSPEPSSNASNDESTPSNNSDTITLSFHGCSNFSRHQPLSHQALNNAGNNAQLQFFAMHNALLRQHIQTAQLHLQMLQGSLETCLAMQELHDKHAQEGKKDD